MNAPLRQTVGGGAPHCSCANVDRRVTACYLYVPDAVFGGACVTICVYFPYPVKTWCSWPTVVAPRVPLTAAG